MRERRVSKQSPRWLCSSGAPCYEFLPNGGYLVPASGLAGDLLSHFWKKLHVAVCRVVSGTRSLLDYACLLIYFLHDKLESVL